MNSVTTVTKRDVSRPVFDHPSVTTVTTPYGVSRYVTVIWGKLPILSENDVVIGVFNEAAIFDYLRSQAVQIVGRDTTIEDILPHCKFDAAHTETFKFVRSGTAIDDLAEMFRALVSPTTRVGAVFVTPSPREQPVSPGKLNCRLHGGASTGPKLRTAGRKIRIDEDRPPSKRRSFLTLVEGSSSAFQPPFHSSSVVASKPLPTHFTTPHTTHPIPL